jgi:uncharacterized protein (DUF2235 family)
MNAITQETGKKPRQLVILCDGTSNSLDVKVGTNVARLLASLDPDNPRQKIFYDPGVGSASYAPSTTLWDRFKQKLDRLMGLAFGRGVFENVGQAYEFLMREYQAGDQIFIFGFSRGAFTARSVVGLVNAFGLLPAHSSNLISTLMNVYFSKPSDDSFTRLGQKLLRWKKNPNRDTLRKKVRSECVPAARQHIPIFFVGIWDTVASLGIPPFDRQIPVLATMANPDGSAKCFQHVRQALALDEHRFMFLPRLYVDADRDFPEGIEPAQCSTQTLQQRWFAGAHCDVGGTYGNNQTISHAALMWLAKEAKALNLEMDLRSLKQSQPEAGAATIHSEMFDMPFWVVAGMHVRDTSVAAGEPFALNGALPALSYPQDTVWKDRRSGWTWGLAALCFMLFYWASGWAALGYGREQLSDPQAWRSVLCEPVRMAMWQLQALLGDCNPIQYGAQANLKAAVFWDTLMILAYAYLLGRMMGRSFASLAGLNTLRAQPRRWLNALGLGLTMLVVGDLIENILTVIWLSWPATTWPLVLGATNLLVTLFSLLKLIGFGMCLTLVGWAVVNWLKQKIMPK